MAERVWRSARRVPWALVAAILLFAACERLAWSRPGLLAFASGHLHPGVDHDALRVHARARSTPREPPPLALFGSSQVRFGLECSILSEELGGRPCVNLAVDGGTPLDMLYVERQLDRAAPRRIALFAVSPAPLRQHIKPTLLGGRGLACVAGSGAWRQFGRADWGDVGFALVLQLSPTLRFKEGALALAGLAWQHPRAVARGRLPEVRDVPPDARGGWQRGVAQLPVLGENTAGLRLQTHALERFIAFERSAGNPVVLVDIPASAEYESTRIEADVQQSFAQLVGSLSTRPDVRFVHRAELPVFEAGDFRDPLHLGGSGRRKLSRALGIILRSVPPPPPLG